MILESTLSDVNPWWWYYLPLIVGPFVGIMAGKKLFRSWSVGAFLGWAVGAAIIAVGWSPFRPLFGLFTLGMMVAALVVVVVGHADEVNEKQKGEDAE